MRRGENIYQRKDKRWEARYKIGYNSETQKAIYKSVYAKSYTEVKEKLQTVKKYQNIQKNVRFGEICILWLSSIQASLKESSYVHYSTIINNRIMKNLGHLKVKEINNNIINKYVNQLVQENLSPKRIKDIVEVIKQIITYAMINNYIEQFILDLHLPKVYTNEVIIFSEEEKKKIINYCENCDKQDNRYFGILIAIFSGIRIGELCALKYSDIDTEKGIIKINKTMQRIKDLSPNAIRKTKIITTLPKSQKAVRDIPASSLLLKEIKKYNLGQDAYILTGKKNQYIEPRSMQNFFQKVLEQCEIEYKKFHVLRHTFATDLLNKGVDIKTLSELLGHSNIKITLELYVHSNLDVKRKAIEKLAV